MSAIGILLLAVGTSIDVLGLSISLCFLGASIGWRSAVLFGVIACGATVSGTFLQWSVPTDHANALIAMQAPAIAILGLRAIRDGVEERQKPDGDSSTIRLGGSVIFAAFASSLDCFVVGSSCPLNLSGTACLPIALGLGSFLAVSIGAFFHSRQAKLESGNAFWIGGVFLVLFAVGKMVAG